MNKRALITGVTGQDGSILAQFLLNKDYKVYGMIRRTTNRNFKNIETILNNPNFELIEGDLADQNSISRAIAKSQCNELYHLGAQSFVQESFKTPQHTADITGLGTLRVLQSIRESGRMKQIKMFNASSSEMFGKMIENPANEYTPFYPRSPYGVSKVFSYYMAKNYRQSYNMFVCSGIMFNHESYKRGQEFVTKKIVKGIKAIFDGDQDYIQLGNIEAKRDWGSAEYYVKAMWLMLQQDIAKDYVVATGQTHSIKDFLDIAFKYIGIDDWSNYIKINSKFFRPAQVDVLKGDASKIKQIGWEYDLTFKELVDNMLDQEFGLPNKINLKDL